MTFRSTYDGGTHRLTPESAVEIQTAFGSDIQMVLDVCAPLPSDDGVLRSAVDRTAAWAARARAAFLRPDRPDLNQLGILQGGTDLALRAESAERTLAVGFDGYAIGGLSVGESRDGDARHPGRHRCRSSRRTSLATSWASATRWGWSRRWRSASTCSTACSPPASPATARSSPPAVATT